MKKASIASALALLAAASFSHGASIHAGLLNYWNFDGNLNDSAGGLSGNASSVTDNGSFSGANGTGGVGFTAGLFGQAITQDGAAGAAQNNGFVAVPRSADTLAGGESITTSFWVQTAGVDTGWQTMIAHGEGSQYRFARRGASNPPIAAYAGGSGDIPTADNIGPAIGIGNGWHHIVGISENGVSTRLWVDGALVATGGAPTITDFGNNGAPGGATPDLWIGANPQTGAQNREWWGEIDDVGQWNRPLTDAEVLQIWTAGSQQGLSLGAIPEPGVASLLALVAGLALLRRRR